MKFHDFLVFKTFGSAKSRKKIVTMKKIIFLIHIFLYARSISGVDSMVLVDVPDLENVT